jgi:hypothetical protein
MAPSFKVIVCGCAQLAACLTESGHCGLYLLSILALRRGQSAIDI